MPFEFRLNSNEESEITTVPDAFRRSLSTKQESRSDMLPVEMIVASPEFPEKFVFDTLSVP
jgi:hypothetical protein